MQFLYIWIRFLTFLHKCFQIKLLKTMELGRRNYLHSINIKFWSHESELKWQRCIPFILMVKRQEADHHIYIGAHCCGNWNSRNWWSSSIAGLSVWNRIFKQMYQHIFQQRIKIQKKKKYWAEENQSRRCLLTSKIQIHRMTWKSISRDRIQ